MLVNLFSYSLNNSTFKSHKTDYGIKNKFQQDVFVRNNQINFKGIPKILLFEDIAKTIRQGEVETTRNLTDPHAISAKLQSYLHVTAEEKQLEIAQHLLSKGLDVNQKDAMGMTPFAIACKKQDEPMFDLFLSHNPDVNTQDVLGDTPLHHAIPNQRLLGILIDKRANPYTKNNFGLPVLHSAVGDLGTVEYLLKRGVNPNSITTEQQTLMHTAAIDGNLDLVGKLLEYDAEIDFRDNEGKTPLFFAKDSEMHRWFLERGAKVDIPDNNGKTVLHERTIKSDLSSMQELLSHGANPNAMDESKRTPILYAGNNIIRRVLLDFGADPNAKTRNGSTLLHNAVQKRNEEVIRTLLEYKADPNVLDSTGKAPLAYATDNKTRRLLLENGADSNSQLYLHLALRTDNEEFFNTLLSTPNIDVNVEDRLSRTPLFYCKKPEDVFKLAERGAIINYPDDHGNTPLHYYYATGDIGIIAALRSLGATEETTNLKGELPHDFMRKFQKYGCWIK